MLPCICSAILDHRRRQNLVRTSVTHSATPCVPLFLFLPHFDVVCDLLLNRRMAIWNLLKWMHLGDLLSTQEARVNRLV